MSNYPTYLGAIFLVLCFHNIYARSSLQSTVPDVLQWGWDRWCQLQPKVGNCNSEHKYFYYDTQMDACRRFTYTGCNGNENKFHTLRDCEQYCKGFGLVLTARVLTLIETCSLQPNPGTCISYVPHYYYDVNAQKCKIFVFGGCGGNPNRFQTERDCMVKCGVLRKKKGKKHY